jgi:hypothetical protein
VVAVEQLALVLLQLRVEGVAAAEGAGVDVAGVGEAVEPRSMLSEVDE